MNITVTNVRKNWDENKDLFTHPDCNMDGECPVLNDNTSSIDVIGRND